MVKRLLAFGLIVVAAQSARANANVSAFAETLFSIGYGADITYGVAADTYWYDFATSGNFSGSVGYAGAFVGTDLVYLATSAASSTTPTGYMKGRIARWMDLSFTNSGSADEQVRIDYTTHGINDLVIDSPPFDGGYSYLECGVNNLSVANSFSYIWGGFGGSTFNQDFTLSWYYETTLAAGETQTLEIYAYTEATASSVPVPEPASLAALAIGAIALLRRRC